MEEVVEVGGGRGWRRWLRLVGGRGWWRWVVEGGDGGGGWWWVEVLEVVVGGGGWRRAWNIGVLWCSREYAFPDSVFSLS